MKCTNTFLAALLLAPALAAAQQAAPAPEEISRTGSAATDRAGPASTPEGQKSREPDAAPAPAAPDAQPSEAKPQPAKPAPEQEPAPAPPRGTPPPKPTSKVAAKVALLDFTLAGTAHPDLARVLGDGAARGVAMARDAPLQ